MHQSPSDSNTTILPQSNMNFVYELLAFACILALVSADAQKDEAMKHMSKIFHECQETFHLSEDEIKTLKNHETPTTQGEKCFIGCFMEKAKMINSDGFNLEEADKISNMFFSGEKLEKALEANRNCQKEVEHVADKCVTGPEVLKCLLKYTPYFKED